jgi:hypothetical protein
MKIETITVMERKNLGNYEHIEISASAKVEEGDDAYSSLLALKTIVHAALEGKALEVKPVESVGPVTYDEETKTNLPVEEVKEKKKRAKKEKEEITVDAVIPEKKESPAIPYNRDLDTHRQLLSSFLNKNHPSWKTIVGVKEFSMGLVGKPFLNNDGAVVESFAKLLSDFFNA